MPTLALPRELTIYTVGELRPEWLAWLARRDAACATDAPEPGADGECCPVDAAAVEEVDAAGVQLLLALSAQLARERRGLRLVQPSRQLAAACQALGLTALLAADPACGASA